MVSNANVNTGSKQTEKFKEDPQLANLVYFLPRKSLEQRESESAAELAGQMVLLPLKIVQKRLEQRARGWLSLALFSCLA